MYASFLSISSLARFLPIYFCLVLSATCSALFAFSSRAFVLPVIKVSTVRIVVKYKAKDAEKTFKT